VLCIDCAVCCGGRVLFGLCVACAFCCAHCVLRLHVACYVLFVLGVAWAV